MSVVIQFQVTGEERIHCSSCQTRISNALCRLPGVRDVRASAETQQVSVTIDASKVSPAQVSARLQQLGYDVAS